MWPLRILLSAQFVWLGGGGTFPVSDYGSYANTGFIVMGGAGHPVGPDGLQIGVNGFYGQNNHDLVAGDKTNPYGVMGMVEYDFAGSDASSTFYVLGEVGLLRHKYSFDTSPETTDSGLGLAAALGYGFPLASISGWVEGRIMSASIDSENTAFLGIVAGISIPLGD